AGRGRDRGLAQARRSGGIAPRGSRVLPARTARCPLCLRCLSELCPPCQLAGGRLFITDGTVRPGNPSTAPGQLAPALPLDRAFRLRVLSPAPTGSKNRRAPRTRDHPGALRDGGAAGACVESTANEAGYSLEHAGCDAVGLCVQGAAVSFVPGLIRWASRSSAAPGAWPAGTGCPGPFARRAPSPPSFFGWRARHSRSIAVDRHPPRL